MTEHLPYRLTSVSPLLIHNGQLADPLNKWSRRSRQSQSKRKRSIPTWEEMAVLNSWAACTWMTTAPPFRRQHPP